jgi:hypothetical protein
VPNGAGMNGKEFCQLFGRRCSFQKSGVGGGGGEGVVAKSNAVLVRHGSNLVPCGAIVREGFSRERVEQRGTNVTVGEEFQSDSAVEFHRYWKESRVSKVKGERKQGKGRRPHGH